MKRATERVWMLAALAITLQSIMPGQTTGQGVEEKILSQYRVTKVGANGTVVGTPGSVLEMHEDGLVAVPAATGSFWYNTRKKDGRIRPNSIQHVPNLREAMESKRPFQVGEKLYLAKLDVAETEVVFYVQSCGDQPYRARLAFQFDKGYQNLPDAKPVLDTIAQVFGVTAPQPVPERPVPRRHHLLYP